MIDLQVTRFIGKKKTTKMNCFFAAAKNWAHVFVFFFLFWNALSMTKKSFETQNALSEFTTSTWNKQMIWFIWSGTIKITIKEMIIWLKEVGATYFRA